MKVRVGHWWNDTDRGNQSTRSKPVPVPRFAQQISHWQALNQTRDFTVRGRLQIAWQHFTVCIKCSSYIQRKLCCHHGTLCEEAMVVYNNYHTEHINVYVKMQSFNVKSNGINEWPNGPALRAKSSPWHYGELFLILLRQLCNNVSIQDCSEHC